MSNTTNRKIHLEEMFVQCCSVLQQDMPTETSKQTCKRMSSFDCSKKIKEEEQVGDKTGRRRTQGERKEDVEHVKTDLNPKQEDANAMCNLSAMYEHGEGVEQVVRKSRRIVRTSCRFRT